MAVVKLDDVVKSRLDKLKGKSTYNDYIEKMVVYFEITRIAPESSFIPPSEEVKKQASRIIEVVRGIEKKQSVQLEAIRNSLQGIGSLPMTENDYISVEEAQELVNRYKSLEEENHKLKDENKRLQMTNGKAIVQVNNDPISSAPLIFRIIDDLETKFEADRFDPQYQRIDKSVLEQALKRIKDLL